MTGTKKPIGDFSKYPLVNRFYILNELTSTPTNMTNTSKAFVNPPYVNSLYYDNLINDGGSFNNGRNTNFNGCATDNDKQQNPLYNMAFSTPLFLPTSTAWSSLEGLTTPATMPDTTSKQSEKSPTIDSEKEQKKAALYKAEMCHNWIERGLCRYGSKCQFAHSETELRKVRDHPKYKTEICKAFWQNGTCPYGNRCCFIHNDKEHFLPTFSAWSSLEDLTTATPATMSDTTSEQLEKSPTIEAEKERIKATLYKVEMCREWEERGSCRYGSKCQFAHSETELRKVQHHPKYKTEICKAFWQNGTCPYGNRCCFIHQKR